MKEKIFIFAVVWLALFSGGAAENVLPEKTVLPIVPPAPAREFRAAWIPTVGNSAWPSKPGLTTAEQKAELIAILDRAVLLKLNAVIFQVRPACDALYESKLEPWSEYLTGVQGRAPYPYYDPLAFAVAEAHKRGLELHAWFNPFRAHHFQAKSPIAANHVTKLHPELVRKYGASEWLDPGEPAVRDYSLRVMLDVVKRYDVDGIHVDDYFYPYKETNSSGKKIDFPDSASWNKFGASSRLTRDDWRRHNVDVFMEKVYFSIKAEKPWVKFGISPFGIWRPGFPPGIKGFDSYAEIYADSRRWLREGWCDYFSPQLYWGIAPTQTSFTTLLDWWNGENVKHRHVWPGMDSLKTSEKWQPAEIVNQIKATRRYADAGHIHWSVSALMKIARLDNALTQEIYRQPALVPACPWLNSTAAPPPKLYVSIWKKSAHIEWKDAGNEPARGWVVQSRENGNWSTQIFPANRSDCHLENANPDAVTVRAVNRVGNLSTPTSWSPAKKISGYSLPVPQPQPGAGRTGGR
jgi:uncharacterized lipoprotein YddW (UPF0748 family)